MRSAALLLFSLCMLAGCAKEGPRYRSLAERGQWETILTVSRERFATDYELSDLYWLSRAQYETGQHNLAGRSIALYFALACEDEITVEARKLALLASQSGHAVEQGKILEELSLMDGTLAEAYYRSLLAAGMVEEANRVFAGYLSHTIDALSFARLLVRSQAASEELAKALERLSVQEAIALLWEAAQQDRDGEAAASLAALAAHYENRAMEEPDRLLLYSAMSRFYQMADQRVLANKYRSLSQGL